VAIQIIKTLYLDYFIDLKMFDTEINPMVVNSTIVVCEDDQAVEVPQGKCLLVVKGHCLVNNYQTRGSRRTSIVRPSSGSKRASRLVNVKKSHTDLNVSALSLSTIVQALAHAPTLIRPTIQAPRFAPGSVVIVLNWHKIIASRSYKRANRSALNFQEGIIPTLRTRDSELEIIHEDEDGDMIDFSSPSGNALSVDYGSSNPRMAAAKAASTPAFHSPGLLPDGFDGNIDSDQSELQNFAARNIRKRMSLPEDSLFMSRINTLRARYDTDKSSTTGSLLKPQLPATPSPADSPRISGDSPP